NASAREARIIASLYYAEGEIERRSVGLGQVPERSAVASHACTARLRAVTARMSEAVLRDWVCRQSTKAPCLADIFCGVARDRPRSARCPRVVSRVSESD